VFKKETLDRQLKEKVQAIISGQMGVSVDNFLVSMPKSFRWYAGDFLYHM
jgi:hypothetical protein